MKHRKTLALAALVATKITEGMMIGEFQVRARTRRGRALVTVTALSVLSLLLAVAPAGAARADSVSITQTTLGNVFTAGAAPTFDVATSEGKVRWTATSYRGETTAGGKKVSGGSVRLRLPVRTLGYYTLTVRAGRATAETTFALVPRPAGPARDGFTYSTQARFSKGLTDWPTKIIPLMSKAGVEAVRDAQRWADIARVDTDTGTVTYDFSGTYQTYMDRLEDAAIAPHMGLGLSHMAYDGGCTPRSGAAQEAFALFAQEVVNHYEGQVEAVGVYNEPNRKGSTARCDYDQGDPKLHAGLAHAVYEALQAADYPVTVSAPELAEGTPELGEAKTWLRTYAAEGGLDDLDAVSLHTYRPKDGPPGPEPEGLHQQQIAPVRQMLDDNGAGDTPIWITEMGWQSTTLDGQERDQAAYLPRAYVLAMSAGVSRLNWYYFMNSKSPRGPQTFGLIRDKDDALGPFTPKPSYVAYAVMTSQLSGLAYQSSDDGTPAGVHSHRFAGAAEPVRVMWTVNGSQTVDLTTEEPIRVTDMTGQTRTLRPTDNHVRLTLTGEPAYVHGDVTVRSP